MPHKSRAISAYDWLIEALKNIPTEDGCVLWPFGKFKSGYGEMLIPKRKPKTPLYVHRVVYEHVHGPIPDGMFICHHCDVRACFRPSHTNRANIWYVVNRKTWTHI